MSLLAPSPDEAYDLGLRAGNGLADSHLLDLGKVAIAQAVNDGLERTNQALLLVAAAFGMVFLVTILSK